MKRIFAALAPFGLVACASPYAGVPYAPPATRVEKVALAADPLPEKVIAYEAASVAGNFGLIGALVDAGVQASRKDRVNDALESINYAPEPRFEQYLTEALAQQRIQLAVSKGPNREKRKFLAAYSGADGAQAYLDFNVTSFGYLNAGSQMWRPVVTADVRLVDANTKKTLMENRIFYNPITPQDGVITISPNPEYQFRNREDMVTQPEKLAAGIDDALRQVADTAVKLLR